MAWTGKRGTDTKEEEPEHKMRNNEHTGERCEGPENTASRERGEKIESRGKEKKRASSSHLVWFELQSQFGTLLIDCNQEKQHAWPCQMIVFGHVCLGEEKLQFGNHSN